MIIITDRATVENGDKMLLFQFKPEDFELKLIIYLASFFIL